MTRAWRSVRLVVCVCVCGVCVMCELVTCASNICMLCNDSGLVFSEVGHVCVGDVSVFPRIRCPMRRSVRPQRWLWKCWRRSSMSRDWTELASPAPRGPTLASSLLRNSSRRYHHLCSIPCCVSSISPSLFHSNSSASIPCCVSSILLHIHSTLCSYIYLHSHCVFHFCVSIPSHQVSIPCWPGFILSLCLHSISSGLHSMLTWLHIVTVSPFHLIRSPFHVDLASYCHCVSIPSHQVSIPCWPGFILSLCLHSISSGRHSMLTWLHIVTVSPFHLIRSPFHVDLASYCHCVSIPSHQVSIPCWPGFILSLSPFHAVLDPFYVIMSPFHPVSLCLHSMLICLHSMSYLHSMSLSGVHSGVLQGPQVHECVLSPGARWGRGGDVSCHVCQGTYIILCYICIYIQYKRSRISSMRKSIYLLKTTPSSHTHRFHPLPLATPTSCSPHPLATPIHSTHSPELSSILWTCAKLKVWMTIVESGWNVWVWWAGGECG